MSTTAGSTSAAAVQDPLVGGAVKSEAGRPPTPETPYQLQESPTNGDGAPTEGFQDEPNNTTSDDDDDDPMSVTELLYSSSSYHAIAKPVTLTMILSALTVIYVNDDQTLEQGAEALSDAYTVWKTDNSQGTATNLGLSLLNALVMVSVICAMTFVIVALYRFRCMKCLIGYLIFSSSMLLGLLGGNLWQTAIEIYRWPVDKPTFFLALWNFALVGVMAVFYGQGIPTYVSQAYLVCTSVILAWELAHFDAWTAWTLLIMLALYDLCAVLTPCGPLKALVEAMSEEEAPEMPGLLYEAELPPEARRPGVPKAQRPQQRPPRSDVAESDSPAAEEEDDNFSRESSGIGADRSTVPSVNPGQEQTEDNNSVPAAEEGPVVELPLAIARVYNLPIVTDTTTTTTTSDSNTIVDNAAPLLDTPSQDNPTPEQLRGMVKVRLPANGGRIIRQPRGRLYLERDRFGTPKRSLWVDRQGRVFAELIEDNNGDTDSKIGDSNNRIRLGLGDFIFYSVLVAKAAQYSFATFCACVLVILAGLGGTLVLLSVFHQALPALPISIFLGVSFYLLTRTILEPWMEQVLMQPYYV